MKIAFWSNANERCGVTENLAAVSVATVIRYPYSVLTMENRLCGNNLGRAFMGRSTIDLLHEAGTNYYDGGGMEGLMRKIYRGDYHSGILVRHLKEVIKNHLYYIPQTRVIHSEIFEYEFNHCIYQLFEMIEEFADICFIHTASQNNLSTKIILDEADLIVVNLCQNQSILEDFFDHYSSLISKALFILNNYDIHSKLGVKRIASMYEVPLENILVIPKNEAFQQAYYYGDVVDFISNQYSCSKDSMNYYFIQSIKRESYLIVKKAVELRKQKEILC